MPEDLLEPLEPGEPPKPSALVLPKLNPFEHLEIGEVGHPPSAQRPDAAQVNDEPCPNCGRLNEKERETCWACFKLLRPKTPPADITLVLDGKTYRSADTGLPEDVRVLFQRIRKEGYSEKLMAQWRGGRSARAAGLPERKAQEGEPIKVIKDQFRSVIRLDGILYYSDDPDLAPELKQLFAYLAANGVTPELMAQLRQYGNKVKLRPHTTAVPSDGDLDFWKEVNDSTPAARQAAPSSRRIPPLVAAGIKIFYCCLFMVPGFEELRLFKEEIRYIEARTAQAEGTVLIVGGYSVSRGGAIGGRRVDISFTTNSGKEMKSRPIAGGAIQAVVGSKFPVYYDPERPSNYAIGTPGDKSYPAAGLYAAYAWLALFGTIILRILWTDVRPYFARPE